MRRLTKQKDGRHNNRDDANDYLSPPINPGAPLLRVNPRLHCYPLSPTNRRGRADSVAASRCEKSTKPTARTPPASLVRIGRRGREVVCSATLAWAFRISVIRGSCRTSHGLTRARRESSATVMGVPVRVIASIAARTACRITLLPFLRCCTIAAVLVGGIELMCRPRWFLAGSSGFQPG